MIFLNSLSDEGPNLWKQARDLLMFFVGGWAFYHEVVTAHAERPMIVGAALALMGYPFFASKKGDN